MNVHAITNVLTDTPVVVNPGLEGTRPALFLLGLMRISCIIPVRIFIQDAKGNVHVLLSGICEVKAKPPRPCASRRVDALTEQQTLQTLKTSNKPTRGRPLALPTPKWACLRFWSFGFLHIAFLLYY